MGQDRTPPRPRKSSSPGVIENLWSIIKREVNYSVINDADTLFTEAARVWESVSLDVVNNLVDDFEPRLRACVAVQGQCLNRYKPVLRGFRRSEQSGEEEMQRLVREQQMMDEFLTRSSQFFEANREKFALTLNVEYAAGIALYENERANGLLWQESCQIIRLLPASVLWKCGLPWGPKRITKVRVPPPTQVDSLE